MPVQETVYRCKKCRRLVATESNTIPVPDQAPSHHAAWRYQASRAKGIPTSCALPPLVGLVLGLGSLAPLLFECTSFLSSRASTWLSFWWFPKSFW